jgi:hypothetical protein
MSNTPKALLDCPVCLAPKGHRHTPNCIVVVVPVGMEHKQFEGSLLMKIAEEIDDEYFKK